jgi:geranylgeranyl diphosphate synthase type II
MGSRFATMLVRESELQPATFAAYQAARGPLIERTLDSAVPTGDALPAPLHAAMRHSLFGGSKRVRPLLVLAAAEAAGGTVGHAMPVACAVEMIHTYSLIHDDLPSMDNSALRRGRPTCHVVYGDAIAVLAGDALHALAFEWIARAARVVAAERVVAVLEEVAAAIGTRGMVGGQVLDLLAEHRTDNARFTPWPPEAQSGVYQIHQWKTAALIRASVRAGAMVGGATPGALDALTQYGEHVGLTFQIIDDVLDEVGETSKLGKDAQHDAASSKLTFPSAYGIDESRRIAGAHTEQALAALSGWGREVDVLRDLARVLLVRET